MHKTLLLFTIGIAALASIGLAQDEKDFPAWMKTVGAANGALKKNIAAKDAAQVTADADKLADAFKQVTAFWEKRGGAADAVAGSQKAATAAGEISAAAKAGNWDQAATSLATVGGTCSGCHMAHRERGPDGYKIK